MNIILAGDNTIPVDLSCQSCQAVKIKWSLDDDDKYGQYFSPGCYRRPPPVASVHKDGAGEMYCVPIIPTLNKTDITINFTFVWLPT